MATLSHGSDNLIVHAFSFRHGYGASYTNSTKFNPFFLHTVHCFSSKSMLQFNYSEIALRSLPTTMRLMISLLQCMWCAQTENAPRKLGNVNIINRMRKRRRMPSMCLLRYFISNFQREEQLMKNQRYFDISLFTTRTLPLLFRHLGI